VGPNRGGVSPLLQKKTKIDRVSEKLCFLAIYYSGQWTKSTNTVILVVRHHHQNALDSTNIEHYCYESAEQFQGTGTSQNAVHFKNLGLRATNQNYFREELKRTSNARNAWCYPLVCLHENLNNLHTRE
jgi:hypothetical protein